MIEIYPIPNKLKNYYQVTEEHNDIAVKGNIICDCDCKHFFIYYIGEQTRFLQPILKPITIDTKKLLRIYAKCPNCGKEIYLYDSITDGMRNRNKQEIQTDNSYKSLTTNKSESNDWEIEIAFNSYGKEETEKCAPDFAWNDLFAEIYIYAKNMKSKQNIALVEVK